MAEGRLGRIRGPFWRLVGALVKSLDAFAIAGASKWTDLAGRAAAGGAVGLGAHVLHASPEEAGAFAAIAAGVGGKAVTEVAQAAAKTLRNKIGESIADRGDEQLAMAHRFSFYVRRLHRFSDALQAGPDASEEVDEARRRTLDAAKRVGIAESTAVGHLNAVEQNGAVVARFETALQEKNFEFLTSPTAFSPAAADLERRMAGLGKRSLEGTQLYMAFQQDKADGKSKEELEAHYGPKLAETVKGLEANLVEEHAPNSKARLAELKARQMEVRERIKQVGPDEPLMDELQKLSEEVGAATAERQAATAQVGDDGNQEAQAETERPAGDGSLAQAGAPVKDEAGQQFTEAAPNEANQPAANMVAAAAQDTPAERENERGAAVETAAGQQVSDPKQENPAAEAGHAPAPAKTEQVQVAADSKHKEADSKDVREEALLAEAGPQAAEAAPGAEPKAGEQQTALAIQDLPGSIESGISEVRPPSPGAAQEESVGREDESRAAVEEEQIQAEQQKGEEASVPAEQPAAGRQAVPTNPQSQKERDMAAMTSPSPSFAPPQVVNDQASMKQAALAAMTTRNRPADNDQETPSLHPAPQSEQRRPEDRAPQ